MSTITLARYLNQIAVTHEYPGKSIIDATSICKYILLYIKVVRNSFYDYLDVSFKIEDRVAKLWTKERVLGSLRKKDG
jgi:hypothetical protein